MRKRIAVLGSTGSIGTQTLDVVAHDPDSYQVEALAAGSNLALLLKQIRSFKPKLVCVSTRQLAEEVELAAGPGFKVVYGDEGLVEAAAGTEAEIVVTAVVGSVGLKPTLAAIDAGKSIGLANKETLVSAGHLVCELARKRGVSLLPVDSEHSAIFQCLNGESPEDIHKLIITASGGSFRDRTRGELVGVTVEEALRHPNWSMGAKITIDSATMMNKGLEVIEAHWLFGMDYDHIEVILHPESVIHSMVEFKDRSVMAQLGNPDMRVPIQYALTYPARKPSPAEPLRLAEIGRLNFRTMDMERFPCLAMAYECGRTGGTAPTVFNAANEVAVALFLQGKIEFLEIEDRIAKALDAHKTVAYPGLDEIMLADQEARLAASQPL